jgi:hypothetical protein
MLFWVWIPGSDLHVDVTKPSHANKPQCVFLFSLGAISNRDDTEVVCIAPTHALAKHGRANKLVIYCRFALSLVVN